LETLWTPATTDAAVAPAGLDPLFELLTDAAILFRFVWGIGNEATTAFGAVGRVPEDVEADVTLLAAFIVVVDEEVDAEGAVEIDGNPAPLVAAEAEGPAERTCVIVGGVGTSEAAELLAGSS
jgi:hypothetical protein